MEDTVFDLASEVNNVEITQCWSSSEPDIPLDAVDDYEDLPLVHCGPFELVSETRKRDVVNEARQHSAADSEIKVIAGGSQQSTHDDLFPGGPRLVPSFDDVTVDDYRERFRTCFVIPTIGGACSSLNFTTFGDDVDSQPSSPTFTDFERSFHDRTSSLVNTAEISSSRRLRHRAASSAVDSGVSEKPEARVLRSEFVRRDDGGNLTNGDCGDDDEDDVTNEVSRRQFHGGGRFVRYRYPTKFHRSASATDLISAAEV